MKTAQQIEAQPEKISAEKPKYRRGQHPNSLKNLVAPWTPETAPKERGKRDASREIAEQAFENNKEAIYKAYAASLLSGNAYAFQVLSDRAYGKLKERRELSGPNGGPIETVGLTDEQLRTEIADLKQRLGFAEGVATMATLGAIEQRADKANGETKNHAVLPGNGLLKA